MKSISPFFVACILYGFMACGSTDMTTEVSVSDRADYETRNQTHEREIVFHCNNTTLSSTEFEIFPNGTLYFKTLNVNLNSSAYHQVGDSVTICAPEVEDTSYAKSFCKPIYFALLAFMFQLQVPVVACLSRNLHKMSRSLLASFIVCLLSAYYIVPVDLWVKNPGFFSVWFSTPSLLNFIALTSVAWMTLLSSDLVVNYLKSLNHITITKGNVIVLKHFTGILKLSLLLGSGIAVFTFVMIHSGMIEKVTGLPREFESLDKMLPFFFPCVLILTLVNVFFFIIGRAFPPRKVDSNFWLRLHEKNWIFFHLHMFVVANWVFGCVVVIGDMWWLWNLFASMSIMVPMLIIRATCVIKNPSKKTKKVITEKFVVGIPDGNSALLTVKVDNPAK